MTINEAINLLEVYNQWRRGADIPQPNPADIDIALEIVIRELKTYIA